MKKSTLPQIHLNLDRISCPIIKQDLNLHSVLVFPGLEPDKGCILFVMSNINLIIRNEKVNDYRTVEEMVREAFWNLYVPGCNEHFVFITSETVVILFQSLTLLPKKKGRLWGRLFTAVGVLNTHRVRKKKLSALDL